jgi:hypothetical protein
MNLKKWRKYPFRKWKAKEIHGNPGNPWKKPGKIEQMGNRTGISDLTNCFLLLLLYIK